MEFNKEKVDAVAITMLKKVKENLNSFRPQSDIDIITYLKKIIDNEVSKNDN